MHLYSVAWIQAGDSQLENVNTFMGKIDTIICEMLM